MMSSYHLHTNSRTLSNLIWTNLEPKLKAPNRPKKPQKGPEFNWFFEEVAKPSRGDFWPRPNPPPRAPHVNVSKETEYIMIRW